MCWLVFIGLFSLILIFCKIYDKIEDYNWKKRWRNS